MPGSASSVAEIRDLLVRFANVEEVVAGDVPAVLVSHGVQCAELLAREHPDDLELQVAGLLHDVGLLIQPGDEIGHPRNGADFVRTLLGPRVAGLIALHVDAQQYLALTRPDYQAGIAPTEGIVEQPPDMKP